MDAELADIKTDYMVSATKAINNGHTVQFNYQPGSQMVVGERSLHLLQFHFHAPSEHTLFGRRFDMEMHLVHKDDWGNLGVLGVFLKKGERNQALQKLWDAIPQEAGGEKNGPKINVAELLPASLRYYRYAGSLTTPPCSEGVSWFVAREPITVAEEQVKQFVKAVPASSRPVQARFDRPILGMR